MNDSYICHCFFVVFVPVIVITFIFFNAFCLISTVGFNIKKGLSHFLVNKLQPLCIQLTF